MRLPAEFRWYWRQARSFKGLLAIYLSSLALTSVLALVDPLIVKWLIDDVLAWGKADMLWIAAGGFFLVFILRLGLMGFESLIEYYGNRRLLFKVRLRLLRHLQRLSADYYHRVPPGQILYRAEQDVDQLADLGGQIVAMVFRVGVTTTLTLGIMAILSWQLTLLVVPLVPLLLLLRRWAYPRLRSASDAVRQDAGERATFLQSHLDSMLDIQLLGREATARRHFVARARRALGSRMRQRWMEVVLSLGTLLTTAAAVAMALGFGGSQVLRGALSVGGLVAFYTYLNRLFDPLQNLVTAYARVQRGGAALRRLREVMDERPTVTDRSGAVSLPSRLEGRVEVSGLRFSYPGGRPVLHGVDLELQPGEKLALVGESGCGKSTLARMMVRAYDPDFGSVTLDGWELRDLKLASLRSRVALVPQDPYVFDDSFAANLLCGATGVSQEVLERRVEQVQLGEFLRGLPKGWDEPMGVLGAKLSGGQRQRLAIARALLRSPTVLLLDEATSALDGPTERAVLDGLDEAVEGRTVLIIAHRMTAVRWADRIAVMEGGRIAEVGDHAALFARGGVYRRLYDHQVLTADEENPTDPATAVTGLAVRA